MCLEDDDLEVLMMMISNDHGNSMAPLWENCFVELFFCIVEGFQSKLLFPCIIWMISSVMSEYRGQQCFHLACKARRSDMLASPEVKKCSEHSPTFMASSDINLEEAEESSGSSVEVNETDLFSLPVLEESEGAREMHPMDGWVD